MGWRSHGRTALVAVLVSATCGGCDVVDRVEDATRAFGERGQEFGEATRRRVASDVERRTWELEVTAIAATKWNRASGVLSGQVQASCRDGEAYEVLHSDPAWTDDELPAGTVFRRTVRCAGPLPQEVRVAGDADGSEAGGFLQQISRGETVVDHRHRLLYAPYSDFVPKYEALHAELGRAVTEAARGCGDRGVAVHDLVVGDRPSTPFRGMRTDGLLTIAVDITCGDGTVVAGARMLPQLPRRLSVR